VDQDAALGIRQIVDIALRALSPGKNDTTTAEMCVNYLTAILAQVVTRDIPTPDLYEDGELRVIAIGPTFANLAADSFDQIRASGSGNVAILLRLLEAVHTIARLTDDPGRRRVLLEHARWVAETADRTLSSPRDRAQFESRYVSVHAELAGADPAQPKKWRSSFS
jgi:uncharacterized membrane protein